MVNIDLDSIPFVQAKYCTVVNNPPRKPQVIVLHDMEAPDKGDTAESVARYFQVLTRPASAHYCIDNNSIVQCVQCKDVAYGAPGMNRRGIHLEHAGYASQARGDWTNPYNTDMLDVSAQLCGKVLMPKYSIQALYLNDDQLRAISSGQDTETTGFCCHYDLTRALKQGTHTDPGQGFPLDIYGDLVTGYAPSELVPQ